MNNHETLNDLAERLIELQNSTTVFLESFGKTNLKAQINDQSEENSIIRRNTLLFFDSPESPILYCISYLKRDHLSEMEYELLTKTNIPIGKIFIDQNKDKKIAKKNITIASTFNVAAARLLNVRSSFLYEKKYDFYIEQRNIGRIMEFFNEESLTRT